MTVLSAVHDGWRRTLRAPALVGGLWVVYLAVPSPVLVDVADAQVAMSEAGAVDPVPALLSLVFSAPGALAHAALFTFLLGGILDRLARDRATGSYGFFGASGMYFFRFLRLDAIALPIQLALLTWVLPLLPGGEVPGWLWLMPPVVAVNLIFDYAKVRMVVEDRRSALGSVAAALRFVVRNIAAVAVVWLLFAGLLAGAWYLAAAYSNSFAAVALFSLARAALRPAFAAAQISLFQGRLAHAGYTARPLQVWPESAAAEAIRPQ